MNIHFIKVASYGSRLKPKEKYLFYCGSTTQKSDPAIDEPISYALIHRHHAYPVVYSSPLLRSRQSARFLSNHVVVLDQLREVQFDLKSLVSAQEYIDAGSALVRQRFVDAFIADNLMETRKEIIARIHSLLVHLSVQQEKEFVCVSHSFLMKIKQAHFLGYDLLQHPETLKQFILPSQKTFPFGGGFRCTVQLQGRNL